MAKQNTSVGYLFLYYLSTVPKNNRIEAACYYEFVEAMKSTAKDQLCQDLNVVALLIINNRRVLELCY
jgi:hypothetical protein